MGTRNYVLKIREIKKGTRNYVLKIEIKKGTSDYVIKIGEIKKGTRNYVLKIREREIKAWISFNFLTVKKYLSE